MKVCNDIKGINKLRDLAICMDYISGKSAKQIVEERKLAIGARRVEIILSDNAAFINPRMAWPKSKRIHRMQQIAKSVEGKLRKDRDELDVLVELRKEIEGDRPLIDNSQHIHMNVSQLAKLIAMKKGQQIDGTGSDASIARRAGDVLPISVGGQAVVEADRDHAIGERQLTDDGKVS